jgi:hypothetical protein
VASPSYLTDSDVIITSPADWQMIREIISVNGMGGGQSFLNNPHYTGMSVN